MANKADTKTVLVTGGATRIGLAISKLFAAEGYGVVIHYRSSGKQASAAAAGIRSSGGRAWIVAGRLDTDAGCRSVLAEAWHLSGGLSVLVNNAAIFEMGGLSDCDWNSFKRNFDTNLFGPAALSREFRKRLMRRKSARGCIVNLLDCRIASDSADSVAYTLSKKALWSLTRMAALEFAPRITVNAVAPGSILPPKGTGIRPNKKVFRDNPLDRKSDVEEVAGAALYLASSPALTGQIIFVDGGRHLA